MYILDKLLYYYFFICFMTVKFTTPQQIDFPWPFPKKKNFFYRFKSMATITFVYVLSRAIFCGININLKNCYSTSFIFYLILVFRVK